MKLRKLFVFFVLCCLLSSCRLGMDNQEKEDEIDIAVVRYDKLINEYVEFNSFSALQKMNTEYAAQTKLLVENILGLGQVNDNNINGELKSFFSDTTLHVLMEDALAKYKDMSDIEKQLTHGFKGLKRELPSIKTPVIYTQFSALNESVIVEDSIIGISLDKYMGRDYPLYKRYFYDYQCKSMNECRIVPDCFTYYLLSEYPFSKESTHTLLDVIVHMGKISYIVTNILDYNSYEEEFGYTKEETKWCESNRKEIWEYMVQNNHLNATDPMIIRKYTKPAPCTAFFGETSPSMIGSWMGIQIIDSYMKHHK
ncbi:MAG: gliding motility lipoprotein GldB, partial [Bacteroides sp.]